MYVVKENVCVYIYIYICSYAALAVPSFKLDPIVLSPTGLYFPIGYMGVGGMHTYLMCVCMCFLCVYLSPCIHTHKTVNVLHPIDLCSALKQTI